MKALDVKPTRPTIHERAAEQCGKHKRPVESAPDIREDLMSMLDDRYGSPVRAWRKALDPKGK